MANFDQKSTIFYGTPCIFSKNGQILSLETPKVEEFVKKRGISQSSEPRDSESRGSCEKTRDFIEFRRSRLRNSRKLWKNRGFHRVQTLETPKVEELVKKQGISRSSDAQDSKSRGTYEKTGDFTEFRRSRLRKSRNLWKNEGFLRKKVPFFTGHPVDGFPCAPLFRAFRHSRLRKSRNFWKNGG